MRLAIFLLLTLGCLSPQNAFSQCVADAGPDITICVGMDSLITEQLGAIPVVEGGSPPYSYNWETFHVWSVGEFTIYFHASDFLNDTTLANPTIINPFEDDLIFTLTVTDSLGETCTDSVLVEFCNFTANLGTFSFDINPGDSVLLGESNISSSCPPNEYIWQPTHGLTDSIGLGVWASPDSSTAYYTILTDSEGCTLTGAPYIYVNVLATGLDDSSGRGLAVRCFPNPLINESIIDVQNASSGAIRFELTDIMGRIVWHETSSNHRQVIKRDALHSTGIYIYRAWQNGVLLGKGTLVVN